MAHVKRFELESSELTSPGTEHVMLLLVEYSTGQLEPDWIECSDTGRSFLLSELPERDRVEVLRRLEVLAALAGTV